MERDSHVHFCSASDDDRDSVLSSKGRFVMGKLRAVDVFTPGMFPVHTYVERTALLVEQKLRDALETPGQIVSLAGPSKSGKTVLVERVVGKETLIVVTGAGISDASQIWDRVLDWFEAPSSKTSSTGNSGSVTVGAKVSGSVGFFGISKATAEGSTTGQVGRNTSTNEIHNRRGLLQVVDEIAGSEFVVLLDDFHYMDASIQAEAARQIKEAARLGVKICVASVLHRSDDMLRANPDLRGRVITIDLEYWKMDELKRIADVGFPQLLLKVDASLIQSFAAESAGSPQLMQQICLQTCFVRDVRETLKNEVSLTLNNNEKKAIFVQTASTTNFQSLVRLLDRGAKTRGTERKTYRFVDSKEGDVYRVILQALAADPPRLAFDYDDLGRRIDRVCADSKPLGSSIVSTLSQMAGIAAESFPTEKVLEWNETKQILDIPDPYLLFYLRWSGHLNSD